MQKQSNKTTQAKIKTTKQKDKKRHNNLAINSSGMHAHTYTYTCTSTSAGTNTTSTSTGTRKGASTVEVTPRAPVGEAVQVAGNTFFSNSTSTDKHINTESIENTITNTSTINSRENCKPAYKLNITHSKKISTNSLQTSISAIASTSNLPTHHNKTSNPMFPAKQEQGREKCATRTMTAEGPYTAEQYRPEATTGAEGDAQSVRTQPQGQESKGAEHNIYTYSRNKIMQLNSHGKNNIPNQNSSMQIFSTATNETIHTATKGPFTGKAGQPRERPRSLRRPISSAKPKTRTHTPNESEKKDPKHW